MALRITGRGEDDKGANQCYRLSNGRVVSREEAVRMVNRGDLPGYHIVEVNGVEYLRDNPDKNERDNIDNQPLIKCP